MNSGIIYKSIREVWLSTLLFGAGFFTFEIIISVVLPTFYDDMAGSILQNPLIQTVIRTLLGTEISDQIGPLAFVSIAWVHPVVLTLLWAHEIMFCTRMPTQEIDRGTIDVLLGFPISRGEAYRSESVVWLLTGIVILGIGWIGNAIGTLALEPELRPGFDATARVLVNLFALYVAVGGVAFLVASGSEHRGRAVGAIFGLVLGSFFLNFLAAFWAPAQAIAFLGILHYYQPFQVIQDGSLPVRDVLALLTVGIVTWGIGGAIFARRDIRTV